MDFSEYLGVYEVLDYNYLSATKAPKLSTDSRGSGIYLDKKKSHLINSKLLVIERDINPFWLKIISQASKPMKSVGNSIIEKVNHTFCISHHSFVILKTNRYKVFLRGPSCKDKPPTKIMNPLSANDFIPYGVVGNPLVIFYSTMIFWRIFQEAFMRKYSRIAKWRFFYKYLHSCSEAFVFKEWIK